MQIKHWTTSMLKKHQILLSLLSPSLSLEDNSSLPRLFLEIYELRGDLQIIFSFEDDQSACNISKWFSLLKMIYLFAIFQNDLALCRPTGGGPRLDRRAGYILRCSQRLASCLWPSAQIGPDLLCHPSSVTCHLSSINHHPSSVICHRPVKVVIIFLWQTDFVTALCSKAWHFWKGGFITNKTGLKISVFINAMIFAFTTFVTNTPLYGKIASKVWKIYFQIYHLIFCML